MGFTSVRDEERESQELELIGGLWKSAPRKGIKTVESRIVDIARMLLAVKKGPTIVIFLSTKISTNTPAGEKSRLISQI